eukprot:GFUD01013140.1.p1 GENE.GFUD01013140.1~~GFUD01013140.1.p1  ORF type:complete len:430 (+),score=166.84 GFUD01013140.1:92-1381(+)
MSSIADLMKLKVADIRGQLDSRGLDSKGTKPTLVARLQEALQGDGMEVNPENEEKSAAELPMKKIIDQVAAETDSPAGSRPGTPTRKSRRVSGNFAEERPETPTRKSRRISGGFDPVEDRPLTPSRRSRRLSGASNLELETESPAGSRPGTPTRRSRRISGGFDPIEERPLTPSRKSRRLSGAGEEDKPEIVKHLLLEDQLAGLGSPNRRISATARNKRISQLGGAAITTIPEIPEKEAILEEPEIAPEVLEKKLTKILEKQDDIVNVSKKKEDVIAKKPTVEEKEEKKEEVITKKVAVDEKENLHKILDQIIIAKQIPRQKPTSGKFWKQGRQQFRQIKRDRGQRNTFEQRVKVKEEKLKNKELAHLLLNRKTLKREEMRKRIEENKAKKEENEKKSERFQVIKNPNKIKRMKKKQLRMLEKRDLVSV